ncbi:MAG: hypothetical protein AAF632_15055 [Bacteroidota bacterium]
MNRAVRWVELDKEISVKLIAAQYPEDREIIPHYFYITSDLTRSVLDEGEFITPRKLPLINDILGKLTNIEADYFIYTNVDIGVMPHFYSSVSKYIDDGYDALIINRRTVSGHYNSIKDLSYIYSEIGEIHEGYDCFVFSKEIFPKLALGKIAIGAPVVGLALFVHLFCLSKQFKLVDNSHLTFHIGNDRVWDNNNLTDYRSHNIKEFDLVMNMLKDKGHQVDTALEYRKRYQEKNGFIAKRKRRQNLIERSVSFLNKKAN